jgi:uncharacterized membrane protein HdeD (DUF308 family)
MLAVLATHWSVLLFRGAIAAIFGILALLWPAITLSVLVALFSVYAFADGCFALVIALRARGAPGFASLLLQGFASVGAALVTFVTFPTMSDVSLAVLIASWAILGGLGEIIAAVTLRRELSAEWPLPTVGALSVGLGLFLLLRANAGAVALAWLIGLYGIAVGCALVALAMRLRQVAYEIAHARPG